MGRFFTIDATTKTIEIGAYPPQGTQQNKEALADLLGVILKIGFEVIDEQKEIRGNVFVLAQDISFLLNERFRSLEENLEKEAKEKGDIVYFDPSHTVLQ